MEERVPFSEEVVSLLMTRLVEKPNHLSGGLLVDLEMILEHGVTNLGATIVIGSMKKLRGENPILARAIFDLLTINGYGTVIAAMEGIDNAEEHATRPSNARRARKAHWARQLRSPKQVTMPGVARKGELKPPGPDFTKPKEFESRLVRVECTNGLMGTKPMMPRGKQLALEMTRKLRGKAKLGSRVLKGVKK